MTWASRRKADIRFEQSCEARGRGRFAGLAATLCWALLLVACAPAAEEDVEGACGDCEPTCGDAVCEGAETAATCELDCSPVPGDGLCTHDENAINTPDDCQPVAGDGACTHDENVDSAPDDCPPVHGDGLCTHDEDASSAPNDCPAVNGDGHCTHAETCADTPADCGTCVACGDDLCSDGETANTCAPDCPAVSGDGFCTHDEDAVSTPADCPAVSGDGACTHDENATSTPDDCPAVNGDGACTHDETCVSAPEDCGECPDACPDDPNKVEPGVCGCGLEDVDIGGEIICPPTVPVVVNARGRTMTVTSVRLTGADRTVVRAVPGETVSIQVAGNVVDSNTSCPTCVTQFYVRVNGIFSRCLGSSTGNFSFNEFATFPAPATPGVYAINPASTWEFECVNGTVASEAISSQTIGLLIVE